MICPLPMILFWTFDHFVVLEGIKRKWAYLNDPARGPRKISLEELNRGFTGVALTFETGPKVQTGRAKAEYFPLPDGKI